MLAFAIRRLLEAAFVMVTVALLAFVLFRFVGDPVNQMVGQDTSLEDRQRLRLELGLEIVQLLLPTLKLALLLVLEGGQVGLDRARGDARPGDRH